MLEIPQSICTERALLGLMLTSDNALKVALSLVEVEDFYLDQHKVLIKAILKLSLDGRAVDAPALIDLLVSQDSLEEAGGLEYLTAVIDCRSTDFSCEAYCQDLREKSALRQAVKLSGVLSEEFLGSTNALATIEHAKSRLDAISKGVHTCEYHTLGELLTKGSPDMLARYEAKRHEGSAGLSGTPTGLADLDALIGGLTPGALIVLGARPGMGKSALIMQIALDVALQGNTALVFSMEMPAETIAARAICSHAGVHTSRVTKGTATPEEWSALHTSRRAIQQAPLLVVDQPSLRLRDLVATARRAHDRAPLGLIVIDYLQLVQAPPGGTRDLEVSAISRGLKALALELKVPVLCASQLSRKVEERPGHRPQLSDLRESGGVEQDADQVLFLLRRDYYDPYDKPGLADLIVAKNRHGAIGTATLVFIKESMTFKGYRPLPIPPHIEEQFNAY